MFYRIAITCACAHPRAVACARTFPGMDLRSLWRIARYWAVLENPWRTIQAAALGWIGLMLVLWLMFARTA